MDGHPAYARAIAELKRSGAARVLDLGCGEAKLLSRLLEEAGAGRFIPKLHDVLQKRADRRFISSNFRKGDDDAWRKALAPEIQSAIWEVIPPEVRDLLGLIP